MDGAPSARLTRYIISFVKASIGSPLTVEDIEDVLASLSFEGAAVSETVRGLFMAVATGGLTMDEALTRYVADHAA